MELQNTYNAGIYCRLSRDDNNGSLESMSILNQRQILSDYVKEKGWNLAGTYIDDGYTGTNYERPDFKRMLNDIEAGRINCVVTKDLSRLGRNYVQTGYYTEDYFPTRNVRYIAINDSIDTARDNNDIAPFQNILNEYYPRAVSKAVRQVKQKGAQQGKFMNSKPPYGLVKSPLDKHKLIVDEDPAEIVRSIFRQYAAGDSARFIATKLNSAGVLSPRGFYYERLGRPNPKPGESTTWCSNTVVQLLKNPAYIGNMAQGKRSVVSFKTKKRRFVRQDDWIIVEGTHEAIIDRETWDIAQQRLLERKHIMTNSNDEISLFAGILRCADCGGSLAFNVKRMTGGEKNIYKCSRYANHGKGICSAHYITEDRLIEVVKEDLRRNAALAAADEKALINKLLLDVNAGYAKESQAHRQKFRDTERRITSISAAVKKLFEEKLAGNVPESLFKTLLSDYEREQTALELKLPELHRAIASMETEQRDVSEWVDKIRRYIDRDGLDRETVVALIECITVSEVYEQDGAAKQDITIRYRFAHSTKRKKESSIA